MQCAALALFLSALLVGCGSEAATTAAGDPDSRTEPRSFAAPEGLTCPTDERVATAGGYLAEWPKGPDTPEAVVDARSTPEEPWVLAGNLAYVLREDGTAFEVHKLVKGPKGWFLHGYEACAEGA